MTGLDPNITGVNTTGVTTSVGDLVIVTDKQFGDTYDDISK